VHERERLFDGGTSPLLKEGIRRNAPCLDRGSHKSSLVQISTYLHCGLKILGGSKKSVLDTCQEHISIGALWEAGLQEW